MSEALPNTSPPAVPPQPSAAVRPSASWLRWLTRLTVVAAAAWAALGAGDTLRGEGEAPRGRFEPTQGGGRRETRDLPYGADRFFVPRWRLTNGPQVRSAFRDVVADAIPSTVRVKVDDHDEALGAVVDAAGWIVTKASVLGSGEVACRLADSRELPATVAVIDKEHDLALLHVEADDLVPVRLAGEQPSVGAWVATVGLWRDPLAVGVVSAPPRALPHQSGVLGVMLEYSDEPVVTRVYPDSGAAEAGVLVNDVIVKVNGEAVPSRRALIRKVGSYSPGDVVELEILRDGETITLSATLMSRSSALPFGNRSEMQNMMGGALSERRFGFPRALQHDTVLRPNECGGPLVNLDGQTVGLNIARSGRTESYAIDAETLAKVTLEMMAVAGARPAELTTQPVVTDAPAQP